MKNIHILPTDKPSRLYQLKNDILRLDYKIDRGEANKHIYITSDEEIIEGDLVYSEARNTLFKVKSICNTSAGYLLIEDDVIMPLEINEVDCKKIILTTDQDLIKDGVQKIDDEFLEWFVKNPSCEEVEVVKEQYHTFVGMKKYPMIPNYKIIISKEEPKQETIKIACVQCCGTGEIQKSTNRKQSNFECDLCNGRGHWNKIIEPKQETLRDKLESLVVQWHQRQEHYVDVAYKHVDDAHTNRKFTYKAIATRDCWKELLMLLNSHKDEK